VAGAPLDLDLPAGRLHAEASGPEDGPLVLCGHGLSANLRWTDPLVPGLVDAGARVVSLDFRGRGASPDTGPGTYGLAAHAADVLAAADALGARAFRYAGWSLGALVGIVVAAEAGERLERLALVDHAGAMDDAAVAAVRAGLARLDVTVPEPQAYLDAIRAASAIRSWSGFWDAFYRYELAEGAEGADGWTPRTSRSACEEDLDAIEPAQTLRARWSALTMPTLLVRCTVPLNGGLVVPDAEVDAFRTAVGDATVHRVDENHFDVVTDPGALEVQIRHLAA
jgi:3-oxoadipate enol-lactonase